MTAYVSAQSGDWSDVATWGGGGYPQDGDVATVLVGHVVEVDSDITMGTNPANQTTYNLWINGTLKWPDTVTGDWTFTIKGNIFVARSGTFTIGTAANPIPAARTATLHFPVDTGAYEWRMLCEGEFRARGAEAYHMGAADKQRTHLSAAVAAGAGVTFVTKDGVDWPVGAKVWFGRSGSPYLAFTTAEEVTILSKTDASTYTADFAYDHYEDDHVFQGDRNVVIKADSTAKGAQLWFQQEVSVLGAQEDVICDIQWVKFQFMGKGITTGAAITYDLLVGTNYDANQHIPTGNFKLSGLVFDEPGDVTAVAVYMTTDVDFLDGDTNLIDNVHCWRMGTSCDIRVRGRMSVKDVTALDMQRNGFNMNNENTELYVDGYWYVGLTSNYSGFHGSPMEIKNSEVFYARYGVYLNSTGRYYNNFAPIVIKDSKINRCVYAGIQTDTIGLRSVDIHNVSFISITQDGLLLNYAYEAFVYDCTFDKCNHQNSSDSRGGINVGNGAGDITIRDCEFGLVFQNYRANVVFGQDWGERGRGRATVEKCIFREPLSVTVQSYEKYVTRAMRWSACRYFIGDYREREKHGPSRSVELVEPVVWNAAMDTDQWPLDYPGLTRHAVVHGGSEVRPESTTVIDSTLPMKIMVYCTLASCQANYVAPVKIPVASGGTVTVKLFMQKNADGQYALPGLRLIGPGFDDVATMTAALFDTWEELTVSGVATHDGVVEFFVIGGSSIPRAGSGFEPPEPSVVWDDVDTGFGVIVFTDGLKVTVV